MKPKKQSSLYRKLATRFLQLLLFVGAAQVLLFWVVWIHVVDQNEQSSNRFLADRLKLDLLPELQPGRSFRELHSALNRIYSINPKLALYIVNADGNIIANLTIEEAGPIVPIDMQPVHRFLNAKSESEFPIYGVDPTYKSRKSIFSVSPISFDGQDAFLYVVFSTHKSKSFDSLTAESSAAVLSVLIGLVSFLSAGAAGIGLLYLLSKRLKSLTTGVERFRHGDLSTRLPTEPYDEIGFLANTFNQMAESLSRNISALEERDRIRRDLIADVSHDLRGPVAIIQSYLKKLDDTSDKGSLARMVDVLKTSTSSLQVLLSQLFDLAKFEARERTVEPIPVEVGEFLSALESAFTPRAHELDVALSVEASSSLPRVMADPTLLERALSNLMDNALRYTPAGGRVRLRAESEGEGVSLRITDTGRGFSEEELARLGAKYFRAHGYAPRTGDSSGLGLSIVKHIVEAHGSTLNVTSMPGQGSTFSFTLRRADP